MVMRDTVKNRRGGTTAFSGRSYSPKKLVSNLQNEIATKWTLYHYLLVITFILMAYNTLQPRVQYVAVSQAPSVRGGAWDEVQLISNFDEPNIKKRVHKIETMPPKKEGREQDQDQDQDQENDIGTTDYEESTNDDDQEQDQEQEQEQQPQQVVEVSLQEALTQPFPDLTRMTEEELYENYDDYINAPFVFLPEVPQKRGEWWGLQDYIRMYQTRAIRRFIPILKRTVQLNQENFNNYFRKNGQPILFRADNLRKAGYTGRSFTWEELQALFPYDQNMDGKTFSQYRPNGKFDGAEIDLGPGLQAIIEDGKIIRKNGLRNFPRNMKVKPEALRKLSVQWPPLIPMNGRQRPALWMGTSTSGTAFHSDCCDNFVMMLAGTKRITLAPTTDHHLLHPRCVGKNRGLCYANIAEPNAPGVSSSHYNKMIVDVKAGEILYMPAGWFHHIENLGPTLMTNFWTHGPFSCGVSSMNKF